jgi:hypothetical protein
MLYGVLPVGQVVLGFGQLLNVACSILKGDQLTAVRQFYRVGKGRRPAQCHQPSLSTSVLKPSGIRGDALCSLELHMGQSAPAPPQGQAC